MTGTRTVRGWRRSWRTVVVAACAGLLALGGAGLATAQEATPTDSPTPVSGIPLINPEGQQIGIVTGSEFDGAVELTITASNLEPGDHGLHIHETGACDPAGEEPFDSAGDHFNPTEAVHGPGHATVVPADAEAATPVAGAPEASPVSGQESHAGDLGNITADENGAASLTITTDSVTFAAVADNSLADADGSAIVIHADPDDLQTDPSGNSGDRVGCGVLFAPAEGGSPVAADDAAAEGEATGPVEALDALTFAPSEITVSPGDTIQVINTGVLEHDFVVDELGIDADLPSGQVVEVQIPEDAAPGTYEFICSVPGHAPAGMVGTLIVE